MLIGIDGNEANVANRVGVGYFAFNTLWGLYQYDSQNNYLIYLKCPPKPDLPPPRKNWQYKVIGPQKFWTRLALPFALFFSSPKPDLFYSPSHYTPPFCPCPKIATIMDLGYLDSQDQFTKKDYFQLVNWTAQSINQCQHLVAISEFTKNEIIKKYHIDPNKISVVYPSVLKPKKNISNNKSLPLHLKSQNYFLYLGTLKPSKNLPFLISSFKSYLNQTQTQDKLVIAGKKGWLYGEIFDEVKKHQLTEKIIFTDYIEENTKWLLLSNAKALVIPSLYEGFGIPALEAMLSKTPVIASNVASLPELVQNYGQLVSPHQEQELVNAMINIEKLKANKEEISRKISAQYSLKSSATKLISVFNHLKLGII